MAKTMVLACVGLLAVGSAGCSDSNGGRSNPAQTDSIGVLELEVNGERTPSESTQSDFVGVAELHCGDLIRRVLAGEQFENRQLVLTGVALNDVQGGLVNVGTPETFRSGWFENFVSVYEVTDQVKAGSSVRMKVRVERSSAITLSRGKSTVLIETAFLE